MAVITGASRGLGRALCEALAAEGYLVVGAARAGTGPAGCALYATLDVADETSVEGFSERVLHTFGRIDVWVNNAAIADIFLVRDGTSARWQRSLETNVLGAVHGSRVFARHVAGRPGTGVLMNITAGAARQARAGWACYAATKAAVERLTEALVREEAGSDLRAFCLSPGPMDTTMQQSVRNLPPEAFPKVQEFCQQHPAGGPVAPAAVAAAVVSLLEEQLRPEAPLAPAVVVVPRPLPA